ncbi:MAG: carboxypeptidase-like regulatory domain-containing protein [Acidobacteria bacterium]|nr:carboxypeptidase-like regulatory domain-containing protein [Acidobacteriota bacterium]
MFRLFLSLLIALFALTGISAQTIVLRGVVTDPSGSAIPGSTVTVSGTGVAKTVSTDENGGYTVPGLAAGKFTFRIVSPGFANFERILNLGGTQPITFDARLNLATEKQEITVSESIQVDLDPSRNVGALVLKAEDLQSLSDNPEDLQSDLQALAGPAAGPNGGQIFIDGFSGGRLPPKESIREVRINSNPFSPEYDKIGFGRIEVFTKPGTDKFRGQAFFNFSDAVFNSRNPFSTIRPPYQQKFFGGNISGPINKRSSFFVDMDRRNQDEASTINAVTLDNNFNTSRFSTAIVNPQTRTDITPRIDYAINANNTFVGRYRFTRNAAENEGLNNLTLPSRAFTRAGNEHTVQLTETAVLGAKAINEVRFQWLKVRNDSLGNISTPTINVLDSFIGGGADFGVNYQNTNRWEITNTTSITSGTHLYKFGGRVRGINDDNYSTNGYAGNYTFSSLRAYQLQVQGLAQGLSNDQIRAQGGGPIQFTLTGGTPLVGINQWDMGIFFADDWRAKQNLTISYGVRYEAQTNIKDRSNIAPRIGFAYGLGKAGAFGRPKTVIRGGWGVFYDRFDESLTLQARRVNGVVQQQFVVPAPNFYPTVPSLAVLGAARRPQAIRVVDSDVRAPQLYQTAIGIERQLPKNITLAVNYTNSRGVHNLRSRNINAPLAGSVTAANPDGNRPYGVAAGNLYLYESSGIFKQNQLIINSSARISPKFTMFGFYSLNFARGNTDGAGTFPANQYDLTSEWGRTAFDVRHRMVMGGSITLPKKISLSPFMIASTGGPYNITAGRDLNGDTQFTDRPALASGPGPNVVQAPWGQYFNINPTSADAIIARNYGQAPGQFNTNLRLSRTWGFGTTKEAAAAAGGPDGPRMFGGMPGGGGPPGGGGGGGGMRGGPGGGGPGGMFGGGGVPGKRYALSLSISARNVLNRVNLGAPLGTASSPLFGTSTSLAGGFFSNSTANRRLDLQLRFTF